MQSKSNATAIRRQWGGDSRTTPMPTVPVRVTDRTTTCGRLAVAVTVAAWAAFIAVTISEQFIDGHSWNPRFKYEAVLYMAIMTLLTLSSLSYLVSRLGFFYRTQSHHRAPSAALDRTLEEGPSLTVLVPTYQEDARVIRMTLLSAALQDYPGLRVVLLIDDPPNPADGRRRKLLEDARALPRQLEETLTSFLSTISEPLNRLETEATAADSATGNQLADLAHLYDEAVVWLRSLAAQQEIVDHTDTFFAEHIVRSLCRDLAVVAAALRDAATSGAGLEADRFLQLCRRLRRIFTAEMSSFERKQYESLSHDSNKAMNLNSYIGLMGGSYRDVLSPGGRALMPAPPDQCDIDVPNPDYVLTLDADSLLLPEYCARMVFLLEQSEHQRVAVAQTPYSSFPGAGTRLERIAGATTDLQHIVHQGLTFYDATFWVGANAVLRKTALDEIVDVQHRGDWEIRRYISDRTVIEDTDSSIELGIHGWKLLNYNERLSYSATPPDFGALCIQRRRWADGGLLIAPKLWRQSRARKARGERGRMAETLLRLNYLASIFWSTLSVLFILAYPFNYQLLTPLVLLVALPYFLAMASDLRYCGYRRIDVLRVYGFNLILIPVNLAGAGNSLLQGITGQRVAFKRTPKVRKRTPSPLLFVLTPYLLVGLAVWTLIRDYEHGLWENFCFAALNGALALYAIVAFMGLWNSLVDIGTNIVAFLYKPESAAINRRMPASSGPSVAGGASNWEMVLHYGPGVGGTAVTEAEAIIKHDDAAVHGGAGEH